MRSSHLTSIILSLLSLLPTPTATTPNFIPLEIPPLPASTTYDQKDASVLKIATFNLQRRAKDTWRAQTHELQNSKSTAIEESLHILREAGLVDAGMDADIENRRMAGFLKAFLEVGADIICLQQVYETELDLLVGHSDISKEWIHIGKKNLPKHQAFHLVTFYRRSKIKEVKVYNKPFPVSCDKRYFQVSSITLENELIFHVMNVHLESELRQAQLKSIYDFIQAQELNSRAMVTVAGTLNLPVDENVPSIFIEEFRCVDVTMRLSARSLAVPRSGSTIVEQQKLYAGQNADRILYLPAVNYNYEYEADTRAGLQPWGAKRLENLDEYISDHTGIVVRYEIMSKTGQECRNSYNFFARVNRLSTPETIPHIVQPSEAISEDARGAEVLVGQPKRPLWLWDRHTASPSPEKKTGFFSTLFPCMQPRKLRT